MLESSGIWKQKLSLVSEMNETDAYVQFDPLIIFESTVYPGIAFLRGGKKLICILLMG